MKSGYLYINHMSLMYLENIFAPNWHILPIRAIPSLYNVKKTQIVYMKDINICKKVFLISIFAFTCFKNLYWLIFFFH